MNTQPKHGDQAPVIDAKGRKRGLKKYVVCPFCDQGRWVRVDAFRNESFTGMCQQCHNKIITERRENHGRWKGGKTKSAHGYICVRVENDDPMISMVKKGSNYVYLHRLTMAKRIGRPLYAWEVVHHKDGNKQNNEIENLVLLEDKADHQTSIAIQKEVKKLEDKIAVLEMENAELRIRIKENRSLK